jgi:hypothetical protein
MDPFVSSGPSGNTTDRAGHEIQAVCVWVNNHHDHPSASSRPVSEHSGSQAIGVLILIKDQIRRTA